MQSNLVKSQFAQKYGFDKPFLWLVGELQSADKLLYKSTMFRIILSGLLLGHCVFLFRTFFR